MLGFVPHPNLWVVKAKQMELCFEPGLLEQFPTFRDLLRGAVYGCGRPFKHVAAELDMTASRLSRMLAENPDDPIHFPAEKLPELIEYTGDRRPVYWMVERFLEDADTKRKNAVDQMVTLLPQIESLLRTAATG